MNRRIFESPAFFKQALEQRIKNESSSGVDFSRRRQILVFERFLARVFQVFGNMAILKGGLVLELRLERARTTKDVDLRLIGSPDDVSEQLNRAGRLDLGDYMTFEVLPDPKHPRIQNDGMLYDGLRYGAHASIGGKPFGQPFGVDVSFADKILGTPDVVKAKDRLSFAGIAPPSLNIYPLESHIAEKLHAYTMPRERVNSRVKDLPDLALLAKIRPVEANHLLQALKRTFEHRKTHPLPVSMPAPPLSWGEVYARMARKDDLEWSNLRTLFEDVQVFLNPILQNKAGSLWNPQTWSWEN